VPLLAPLLVLVLAGVSACSSGKGAGPRPRPALAAAPPAATLQASWLDGESALRPAHLERLLDLSTLDPEATALVQRAAAAFHFPDTSQLTTLFSLCSASVDESGGRTVIHQDLGALSVDLESQIAGRPSPKLQAEIDALTGAGGIVRFEKEDHSDYVLVRRWLLPDICIRRDLSLISAYDTFLHELTHASRRDPLTREPRASRLDKAAYLDAVVQLPGDEVDAYIAGSQGRLHLERSTEALLKPLRPLFSASGELVGSREVLGRAILAPPPVGLGYAGSSMRQAHASALDAERSYLDTSLYVVTQSLEQRKQQRVVYEHNVGAHTHNVEAWRQQQDLARSRGDAAAEQKAREQISAEQESAAQARKLLDATVASLNRLDTESRRLQGELKLLPKK
jgi:hypothetical protein